MMTRSRRRMMGLIAITAISSFGVVVAQGCGSDSFTSAPSTDGGNQDASTDGASSTDDGGNAGDSGAGCLIVPPAIPAADQAFCNAFATVYGRCGECEVCRQDDVSNCAAFADTFSDVFKSAVVDCQDTLTDCASLEKQDFSTSTCLTSKLIAAEPTTAQQAAKQAICDACPADGGGSDRLDCDHFFVAADGGATAGTAMLEFSDTIASEIQAQCGSALACSQGVYLVCEGNQVCNGKNPAPKTACAQGLCKN